MNRWRDVPTLLNQEFDLQLQEYSRRRSVNVLPPINIAVSIDGAITVDAVKTALHHLINRHQALRTGFVPSDQVGATERRAIFERFARKLVVESPLYAQRLYETATATLSLYDVGDATCESAERLVGRIIHEDEVSLFTYDRPPLLRSALIRLSSRRHLLLMAVPRVLCDVVSRIAIVRDLKTIYASVVSGTEMAPSWEHEIEYAAALKAWREQSEPGLLEESTTYWRRQWAEHRRDQVCGAGDLPLALPTSKWANVKMPPAEIEWFVFDDESAAAIRESLEREAVSPLALFAAACGGVLHRYTGKMQVPLWINFANRTGAMQNVLGNVSNSHAVWFDMSCSRSGSEVLRECSRVVHEAAAHQHLSLELLWQRIGHRWDNGMRIELVLYDDLYNEVLTGKGPCDISMVPARLRIGRLSNAQLQIGVHRSAKDLALSASYASTLFTREATRQFLGDLVANISNIITNPIAKHGVFVERRVTSVS